MRVRALQALHMLFLPPQPQVTVCMQQDRERAIKGKEKELADKVGADMHNILYDMLMPLHTWTLRVLV